VKGQGKATWGGRVVCVGERTARGQKMSGKNSYVKSLKSPTLSKKGKKEGKGDLRWFGKRELKRKSMPALSPLETSQKLGGEGEGGKSDKSQTRPVDALHLMVIVGRGKGVKGTRRLIRVCQVLVFVK